jgi:hypothetical protein
MQVLSRFFSKKLIDRHDSSGWNTAKGAAPFDPRHTPWDPAHTAFDPGRATFDTGYTMLGRGHTACD